MSNDTISTSWLAKQAEDARALSAASDIPKIMAVDDHRYMVELSCRGLVKSDSGSIVEADWFVLGIQFGADYLRRFNPATIAIFHPDDIFHPNCLSHAICVGRRYPGTGIIELVEMAFSIITYQSFNLRDPLNREAAKWARDQPRDRFPIDRRTLRRRTLNLQIEKVPMP